MEHKTQILSCFRNVGIDLPDIQEGGDLDLRDYFIDSLAFISAVVEIENTLGIEIPDDFLDYDKFASFCSFCEAIETLLVQ